MGRTISDEDLAFANEGRYLEDEDNKRFRDYQPEGLLKGTIFDYVPDPFQMNEYLADKRGFPSISDLDADEDNKRFRDYQLRQTMENFSEILAQRREEMLLERALADPDANDPEQVQMRERARTQAAERARAYRSR